MSNNTSINAKKNPYQRLEAWIEGVKSQKPLRENYGPHNQPRLQKLFESFPTEWTTRPDDWRKVNGYPE